MDSVGWDAITGRAEAAVRDLPEDAILFGFSMGAGVVSELWPVRLAAAAVILLHAPAAVPGGVPSGTPVQAHVATDDRFAAADRMDALRETQNARAPTRRFSCIPASGLLDRSRAAGLRRHRGRAGLAPHRRAARDALISRRCRIRTVAVRRVDREVVVTLVVRGRCGRWSWSR